MLLVHLLTIKQLNNLNFNRSTIPQSNTHAHSKYIKNQFLKTDLLRHTNFGIQYQKINITAITIVNAQINQNERV